MAKTSTRQLIAINFTKMIGKNIKTAKANQAKKKAEKQCN